MKRDAWVALTAIALATSRVRVGTAIVNPFSCDPSEGERLTHRPR